MRTALLMLFAASTVCAQQPAKWRLVEEWRVGGEVEGPHSFGDIRGMAIMPDGRIVLVDYKDEQVHFLDAKGQPIRTVGRKGAGPGEYARANGLAVSANGTVIINDPGNNRFTLLAPNGDFIRTIPILNRWGSSAMWDAYYNAAGLVDEYVVVRQAGKTEAVSGRRVWSADFSKIDTIMTTACPDAPRANPDDFRYEFRGATGSMMMSIPFVSPSLPSVRSHDRAIWAGRYPGYGTIERTPAGKCKPDVTIQLRGARVAFPAVMRDSQVERVKQNAARYSTIEPDLGKIPREFPAYDALFFDASQRLWVDRLTEAKTRHFEVFTRTGALLADVETPVIIRNYLPLIITNDRMLGFVADDDDVLHLVSFRIDRNLPRGRTGGLR
jgi:hypothetical protein